MDLHPAMCYFINLCVLFEYIFQNEIASCRKIIVSFLSCIDELGSNASWCQRLPAFLLPFFPAWLLLLLLADGWQLFKDVLTQSLLTDHALNLFIVLQQFS